MVHIAGFLSGKIPIFSKYSHYSINPKATIILLNISVFSYIPLKFSDPGPKAKTGTITPV
jgi:hypothetical protein